MAGAHSLLEAPPCCAPLSLQDGCVDYAEFRQFVCLLPGEWCWAATAGAISSTHCPAVDAPMTCIPAALPCTANHPLLAEMSLAGPLPLPTGPRACRRARVAGADPVGMDRLGFLGECHGVSAGPRAAQPAAGGWLWVARCSPCSLVLQWLLHTPLHPPSRQPLVGGLLHTAVQALGRLLHTALHASPSLPLAGGLLHYPFPCPRPGKLPQSALHAPPSQLIELRVTC